MSPTPLQIKRLLVDAGFEVFRTRGDEVLLAERPRENLILDSLVSLKCGPPLTVRAVFRAQKSSFQHDDAAQLFRRVRGLASFAVGFEERSAYVVPVTDPGDASHLLDEFYDVLVAAEASSFDAAIALLRQALVFDKRLT
jgi:hypothetical protein